MLTLLLAGAGCGDDAQQANQGSQSSLPGTNSTASASTTSATTTALPKRPDPKQCVGVYPEGRPSGYRLTPFSVNEGATGTIPTETLSSSHSSTGTSTNSSGVGTNTNTNSTGDSSGSGCKEPPACIGHRSPMWELHDYQPLSCGYDQDYGFVDFLGTPTMVVFLAGWCSYCRSQTTGLERLRLELTREGYKFNFAIIHLASANTIEYRREIISRTSIPVFQDNEFTKLEKAHAAHKDEMFIYDSKGILRDLFVHEDSRSTNLSSPEGYAIVKQAFISVLKGSQ